MTLDLLIKAFLYVQSDPNFWGAMGFTTAVAMFIGALIYDGEVPQARKGLLSVISYATILFWVNMSRVSNVTDSFRQFSSLDHPEYSLAGIVATFCITVSWVFGIVLGVHSFNIKYKDTHHRINLLGKEIKKIWKKH